MRIIVLSDSHGNVANVRKIIKKHAEDADCFIHLGDGERDCLALMLEYPQLEIHHVCGNCDFYSNARSLEILRKGGKKIMYTHGHHYHVKQGLNELLYAAQGNDADVVLYGHTHIPESDYIDGRYLLNPGSCSGHEHPPTYAMLDLTKAGIVPVLVKLNGSRLF